MWLDIEEYAALKSDTASWALMELREVKNRKTGEVSREWRRGRVVADLGQAHKCFCQPGRKPMDKYGRRLYVPGKIILLVIKEYNSTLDRIEKSFPLGFEDPRYKTRDFPDHVDVTGDIRIEFSTTQYGGMEWAVSFRKTVKDKETGKPKPYWKSTYWHSSPHGCLSGLYQEMLLMGDAKNEEAIKHFEWVREAVFTAIMELGYEVPPLRQPKRKRTPVRGK